MADLQVCYFCGSGPDSSLGEYAVVPSALNPTEAQQRSVVLCPDCRGKLTTVMEPVVEATRADVGSGGGGASAGPGGAGAGGESTGAGDTDADGASGGASAGDASVQPGGTDGTDAGPSSGATSDDVGPWGGTAGDDRDESAVGDPTAGDVTSDAGTTDNPAEDATSGGTADAPSTEPSRGTDDVAVPPSGPDDADDSDDGVSIDAGSAGPGADDAGEAGESPDAATGGANDPTEDADDPTADADDAPPESNAPRDQPHADDELVGRNNEAYNKTLRLLQNREFPVDRHEIEKVAASAYQLDPQEVSDAIDALIRKGMLTQEGAQLQRP